MSRYQRLVFLTRFGFSNFEGGHTVNRRPSRKLVPRPAVKSASLPLFILPAPLLEEERNTVTPAGLADLADPFRINRSCARSQLAADDRPID